MELDLWTELQQKSAQLNTAVKTLRNSGSEYAAAERDYIKSQNAYDYFARNDDGKGLERGKLTAEIIKLLNNRTDGKYQDRWDRIWDDLSLLKYKRPEHDDYWLWNYDFFNASIEELNRIKSMILEV